MATGSDWRAADAAALIVVVLRHPGPVEPSEIRVEQKNWMQSLVF